MVTEAKIKANNASKKRNTTTMLLRLNYNTDILEKLGQVDSKMGYIKALIREDLKKEKRKARRQK